MASEPISSTVKAVELGLRLRARRDQLGLTAAAVGRITGIGGNNLSSIEIAKRRLTSTKLTELAVMAEQSLHREGDAPPNPPEPSDRTSDQG